MSRIVLALVITAAAVPAAAQSLPVRLPDGATWTFEARHDREIIGPEAKAFSVTTSKRLTWRAAPAGQGRLRLDPISVVANSGMPAEAASTQTLSIPVELDVDQSLAPNGVRNSDEVREATRQLILKTGDEADIERMIAANPAILDQTAMSLAGRELGLLARAQGTTLKLDLPAYSDDDVPNPAGGPPIRSRMTYSLDAYDATAGRAVVSWHGVLDPQSMRDSMMEAAGRASPEHRAAADAAFSKLQLDNDRSCRGEIDIPTGLALRVECVMKITLTSGGDTRGSTDRWTITQTLPQTLLGNP